MMLSIHERPTTIEFTLYYDGDVFEASYIDTAGKQLIGALERTTRDPAVLIATLFETI